MIINYFKIAIRNILKNKLFTFINVFGLALSMSVGLILILIMTDFLRSDQFNVNKDRIYRVVTKSGSERYGTSPKPVTDELVKNYPGVEKHVILTRKSGMIMYNQNNIEAEGFYASPEFFEVFSYNLEAGNKADVLTEPFSIVLTKELAVKLFKDENPVGKTIKFEDTGEFRITGVIDNKKPRSHFNFEILLSYSTIESSNKDLFESLESWKNYYQNFSYVMLQEGVDPESIVHNLGEIYKARYNGIFRTEVEFDLQKLTKISTGNINANEIGMAIPFIIFYIFGFITFLVILLAVFNYTNLNIAKYLSRAREVGLRKIMGATKGKIVFQYLTESVLLSLFSMLIACMLVEVVLPENLRLDPDRSDMMGFPRTPIAYLVFFFFGLFVGVFAGIFPSLYLASFKPLKAMKGVIRIQGYTTGFNWRKLLMTVQFIASIIFVLLTAILLRQLQDLKHKDLGFNEKNKIDLLLQGVDYKVLISELQTHSAINNISANSSIPCVGGTSSGTYLHPQTNDTVGIKDIFIDHRYIRTIGLKIIAGRDFLESDGAGVEANVIITKKTTEYFGFENPADALGKTIRVPAMNYKDWQSPGKNLIIVGIASDFYYASPMDEIAPIILRYIPEFFGRLVIDFNPVNKTELFSFIDQKWNQIEQTHPPRYKEVTEEMDVVFGIFDTLLGFVGYISVLSIVIALMGLLGIITFNVQTRAKEIGIRKAMGAGAEEIVYTLAKDFIIIVIISLVVAISVVSFIAIQIKMMLPEFVGLDPLAMISGIFIILSLVVLTIASQTVRALRANPIDALRYE